MYIRSIIEMVLSSITSLHQTIPSQLHLPLREVRGLTKKGTKGCECEEVFRRHGSRFLLSGSRVFVGGRKVLGSLVSCMWWVSEI